MGLKHNTQSQRTLHKNSRKKNYIHAASHWNFLILWESYRCNNVDGIKLYIISTGSTNRRHMKITHQFLYYASTSPDAILTYTASDMVLTAHSDVSYLNETNKRICIGGNLFLEGDNSNTTNNGGVMT